MRQRDTPVRLGLSIRSKLSWCGAVCQAPKWLLPRSGGSGIPCFSPQCPHSRRAAKVGVCVYRHLESWTPADAAAASTDSRCSPFGLGLNQQRGGGEFVYPHWLYRGRRVPDGNLVQCRRALPNAKHSGEKPQAERRSVRARRAKSAPEEDAQCLYTPPPLRLTLTGASQRLCGYARHAGRRGV